MTRTHWRLVVCVFLACLAGDYARAQLWLRPAHPDMGQVWFAAKAVLHGQNPYALIGPGLTFDWPAPLFYPLPAALVALPIGALSEPTAVFVFSAVGVGALAWALTEQGWAGLWAFTSLSVQHAVLIAQWSPLLTGAAVIAPLSAILIAKPTVGAAVFAYRPSWWAVGGALFFVTLAFLLQPDWVHAWRHALAPASVGQGARFPYIAPITQPGGLLVLLALSRWRRPEARLLVLLACVPQSMIPYETVFLFLIPRGWRQVLGLSALSWCVGIYSQMVFGTPRGLTYDILAYAPTITLMLYLPCTLMVLRRPNEGVLPARFERRIARLPEWLRGWAPHRPDADPR